MYCPECGKDVNDKAVVCVHCGCSLNILHALKTAFTVNEDEKSWLITLLLCLLLGPFGIHRFYTGYIGIGIFQLISAGGLGIWWIIDLIMIVCKSYETKNGEKLV